MCTREQSYVLRMLIILWARWLSRMQARKFLCPGAPGKCRMEAFCRSEASSRAGQVAEGEAHKCGGCRSPGKPQLHQCRVHRQQCPPQTVLRIGRSTWDPALSARCLGS